MTRREELESERDFLLESLDDLELERASGGIDEESYTALHDDYTARSAAAIRALRDGDDAPPAPAKAPPSRRRVAVVAVIVVFAVVAGVALAGAVGVRLPGQTSSGNSPTADAGSSGGNLATLKRAVEAAPDDYDLRLALASAYENRGELLDAVKAWDAAIAIDPNRAEAFAQRGRILYVLSQQLPSQDAQTQFVTNASAAFDKAIEVDPTYADSYYFRSILRAATGQYGAAQADLQTYLAASPNGDWRTQALDLLGKVTAALGTTSTTVPASP